jgi:hypothetical protein
MQRDGTDEFFTQFIFKIHFIFVPGLPLANRHFVSAVAM